MGIVQLIFVMFFKFEIKYQYIMIISNDDIYFFIKFSCFFISSSLFSFTDDTIEKDPLTISKSSNLLFS